MAASESAVVIVGTGLAGGNAAAMLRDQGFDDRVMLIGREPGVPFGRPPLSKTYLRSEEELDGWYVRPADWYDEHDVDRVVATVAEIDPSAHALKLDSGDTITYRQVLIATGGRNRRLNIPGADLHGIHQLRTVAECDAIKAEAQPGRHAVVIGMGFIGCEVTASLRELGVSVTAVYGGQAPLERVLGPDVGGSLAAIHRTNDVDLVPEAQIAAFEGSERVEAALTGDGRRLPCDFVVAGIGIEPDVPNLVGSSVAVSNGVLVDERCRTSDPDVYAAGDVANQLHPLFGRVRVEHYNNAEKQGRAAALAMLGSADAYDYVHSFWSDQYEHSLEYVGHADHWDQVVFRGSPEDEQLLGFYMQGDHLKAAFGLDRGGDPEAEEDSEMAACARLVGQRAHPPTAQLADEHVDLWSLVD